MTDKKNKGMTFWSERVRQYQNDPRANTNDIWLRKLEIDYVDNVIKKYRLKNIMDFGCANGYSTFHLAEKNLESQFIGIDINADMIKAASERLKDVSVPNFKFKKLNILEEDMKEEYDFIYTIRVLQNLESLETQKNVFDKILSLLKDGGKFLYIESYLDGYTQLNQDRKNMQLTPLPIHEHLTLLTDDFDNYVKEKMECVEMESLSSSYYLITRLLYSYIAHMNNEAIDYNHPIHQVAALVPQIGNYGPQKACLFQKFIENDREDV